MTALATGASPEEDLQRKELQKLLNFDCRPKLEPIAREAIEPWLVRVDGVLANGAEKYRVGDTRENVLRHLGEYLGLMLNRLESEEELYGFTARVQRSVAELLGKIPQRFGQ